MLRVKDKFWIWGHAAGSHNNQYGIEGLSQMTPLEGACYLGVPNLVMVRYSNVPAPPFEQYAMAFRPLQNVVWSIIGDASSSGNDLPIVVDLAKKFPNICGVIMDDFFQGVNEKGEGKLALCTPEELTNFKSQLVVNGKKLDLWVVLYTHQVELPLAKHIAESDVSALWTWHANDIKILEQNFERTEKLYPLCRKVLGCYMYNYGDGKPMPVSLMESQCETGLRWLQEGRIEGMIFLASCICDLGLEAVEWTREWIQEVGEKKLSP